MTLLVRQVSYMPDATDSRIVALLARKPVRVATMPIADKTARIVSAIMVREEMYRADHAQHLLHGIGLTSTTEKRSVPGYCESDAI
ncbi:hypothetical protein [Polymorphobacter megasporae]|uniref:hypothetical protein n=1 Tax=Glacieibacterium megasporae TaxID=2835787 RepID=UPI001C1DFE33|nr:hypothetical protein [Polymorphobacter megasporae]UAJ08967.1 hypothetical protein KTC28_11385 [Polymorphobacter megasporae]